MIDFVNNIRHSQKTIYDSIPSDDEDLFIPTPVLQRILSNHLVGISLAGYAPRTRSKIVKTEICNALGYPVPKSFKKTQPRFQGQNFDAYTQKSLNVQIWNEPIDPERRYVLLKVDSEDIICAVKVITGIELATYDNTGTLTHKYQATMTSLGRSALLSPDDTGAVREYMESPSVDLFATNPNSKPKPKQLRSISQIYEALLPMVRGSIAYIGAGQERNRGAELHKLICEHLGYSQYQDDGTYPDIANQLLEIKLQTSPTIDLGLHSPEDGACIMEVCGHRFYSEDIRYVIFDGTVHKGNIVLNHLYIVNGRDFTKHFPLFKGKGKNAKLQLPLPQDFFD